MEVLAEAEEKLERFYYILLFCGIKHTHFPKSVQLIILPSHLEEEKGELFGKALEHFIFMELSAHNCYNELDYELNFWRTKSGLEVDFVLGGDEVAIEIKGTNRVDKRDLRSLITFIEEYSPRKSMVVCNEREERVCKEIQIMPWRKFLYDLWDACRPANRLCIGCRGKKPNPEALC